VEYNGCLFCPNSHILFVWWLDATYPGRLLTTQDAGVFSNEAFAEIVQDDDKPTEKLSALM
jgi:hypothetical protein